MSDTIKIFYLKINPSMAFPFGGISRKYLPSMLAAQLFMQTTREPNSCAVDPPATVEEMKNKLQRMRVSHVIAGL